MRKFLFSALLLFLFTSSPALLAQEDTIEEYGLFKHNPILVGGEDLRQGPTYERAYLNKITGPGGEKVTYSRSGSCCGLKPQMVSLAADFWICMKLLMKDWKNR